MSFYRLLEIILLNNRFLGFLGLIERIYFELYTIIIWSWLTRQCSIEGS